jgi:Zn-dependent peptidase ImmA (M78 family)
MRSPDFAEKKAIVLLDELGDSELPVPVERIARRLGAQITYEPFEGEISGMLYRSPGTTVIGVNSSHAPTRQRFTVAHEIGHLRMHQGEGVIIDRFVRVNWRNGESNREETQANRFAAGLLMPRSLVCKEIERTLSRQPDLIPYDLAAMLAKRFDVSPAAMQYRLINLEILDPYSLAG